MDQLKFVCERYTASVLLVGMLVIAGVIYWDFLLLNNLYLYKDIGSDTLNVFYTRFVHNADYIRDTGLPAWSFNQGMGQTIFPHSIGNPFEWPLLLAGSERLAYWIVYVEVLKLLLAGWLFYLYLGMLGLSAYTRLLGGLLFAFSGFMVLGGGWYVFSTEGVCFALQLYAFERFLLRKQWGLLPLSVALAVGINPFTSYIFGLFFAIYGVFRFCEVHGWQPRGLIRFLFTWLMLEFFGVLIATIFFMPGLLEMLNSQRVSGEASLISQLFSLSIFTTDNFLSILVAISRFFSNDLLGTGSQFRGWRNYLEDPIFYSGLIALPLFFMGLVSGKKRSVGLYILFALVISIPIFFPFFRSVFWLFASDYFRTYSLFVVLLLLYFGLRRFDGLLADGHVNLLLIIGVMLPLYGFLIYLDSMSAEFMERGVAGLAAIMLLIYGLLIAGMRYVKDRKLLGLLILLLVGFELAWMGSITVNERRILSAEEHESRVGYNDYTLDAVKKINASDPSLFRLEKTYSSGVAEHSTLNDGKVQGYRSTASYHSFNQFYYVKFFQEMGLIDKNNPDTARWVPGLVSRPLLLSFASVKYLLVRKGDNIRPYLPLGFKHVDTVENIFVLTNPYAMPLAFVYDKYLPVEEFMGLSKPVKDIVLLNAVVVESPEVVEGGAMVALDTKPYKTRYTIEEYQRDTKDKQAKGLNITSHDQNRIEGDITLTQNGMLFFSIPFDKGWSLTVDGEAVELERVNIGFMGAMLPAGQHTIKLIYSYPYLWLYLVVSLASLAIYFWLLWGKASQPRIRGWLAG